MSLALPALLLSALAANPVAPRPGARPTLAIVNATVIDLRKFGTSTEDLTGATILIEGDHIVAVGRPADVQIPPGIQRIDAHGRFAVPGLIDGYGAMRSEAYARAYLYEGVTSVYVPQTTPKDPEGDSEVKVVSPGDAGPRLFLGAQVSGYDPDGNDLSDKPLADMRLHRKRLAPEQLTERVEKLAARGVRGLTLGFDLWPDQLDAVVAAAKARGLATIGLLGFTRYSYAIRAGVGAFVHLERYQTELVPASVWLAYADDPSGPGAMQAGRAVCAADPLSPAAADYGALLAQHATALMPTFTVEATADSLGIPNPWSAKVACLFQPADLDTPVDPKTGESGFLKGSTPERKERLQRCARRKQDMDAHLRALGAHYLSGSAAPRFGIMPGSGLHQELALLRQAGLSPREALAAATSNFPDVYGWPDVGRIEPQRKADLLLLDSDPRQDIAALEQIHTLVFGGAVVDREALLKARRSPVRP